MKRTLRARQPDGRRSSSSKGSLARALARSVKRWIARRCFGMGEGSGRSSRRRCCFFTLGGRRVKMLLVLLLLSLVSVQETLRWHAKG